MEKIITKLNLGSGDSPIDGFINIDRKNGNEAYPLSYDETSVDEIRASHLLEHFAHVEVLNVLKNWVSKLKDGGVLKIAVPDFKKITQLYAQKDGANILGYVMGGQVDANDFHKTLFDEDSLRALMTEAGLTDIKKWISEINDCAALPVSLNLQGTKHSLNILPQGAKYDIESGVDSPKRANQDTEKLRAVNLEIAGKKYNRYSQGGEDGIIEEIFNRIGIENKWCFEAGAADGLLFSNTRKLIEDGWNAVLVESDKEKFDNLISNNLTHISGRKVHCIGEKLEQSGESSLDNILERANAPIDIDLVSIDIDGQDYHILNSMMNYKPRVIVIEYALPGDAERFRGEEFIPAIDGVGQAGSQAIVRLLCGKRYAPVIQTGTNIIAVRGDLLPLLCGEKQTDKVVEKPVKIRAVMSMPRITWTDNIFCAIREAVVAMGINLEKGSGVYWGQVLTRMMESHLNDGTDYIITIDYDTYFKKEHIQRLCQLMQENPNIDAIVPLQVKRENDLVMFSKADEQGKPLTRVPLEEFNKELTPIVNGHFGLTIFRVSALKKLKRPWMMPIPDVNGGWDDGHTDEDIYFWQNFYRSGLKAALAPQINIGHIQLMCTFPGTAEDNWKPIHNYITDVEKGDMPEHCIPKVEFFK